MEKLTVEEAKMRVNATDDRTLSGKPSELDLGEVTPEQAVAARIAEWTTEDSPELEVADDRTLSGSTPEPKLHPAVEQILRWFQSSHLSVDLQWVANPCGELAEQMAHSLPSDPELTAGLRKLLEAKDCFVRAKLAAIKAGE